MKNFKRILLAVVAVFAAVLLVACGAKSDNGTYVYKPSKTEVKEILEEQGAPSSRVDALIDKQVKVRRLNTKFQEMCSLLIYLVRRVQVMKLLWKCSKTLNSNVQNNTREGQRVSALFLL